MKREKKKTKKKGLGFGAIRLSTYPNAKKFRDGSKPIECEYIDDGVKDSSGYGVFIDRTHVDVFYGQGNNNWRKGKRFKSAKDARKWANKNSRGSK